MPTAYSASPLSAKHYHICNGILASASKQKLIRITLKVSGEVTSKHLQFSAEKYGVTIFGDVLDSTDQQEMI